MITEHHEITTIISCDDGRMGSMCSDPVTITGTMADAWEYGDERGWVMIGNAARCPHCEGERLRVEEQQRRKR